MKSIVQIDTQANEHDSERSDLTSELLLLNLDEGDGTFCNVTFDLLLRELKVTDSKLRHNLHDVRFDLDAPASELEIQLVVSLAIFDDFCAAVQLLTHMLEGALVNDYYSASASNTFGVEGVEKRRAYCHGLVAIEHSSDIEDAAVAICYAQL